MNSSEDEGFERKLEVSPRRPLHTRSGVDFHFDVYKQTHTYSSPCRRDHEALKSQQSFIAFTCSLALFLATRHACYLQVLHSVQHSLHYPPSRKSLPRYGQTVAPAPRPHAAATTLTSVVQPHCTCPPWLAGSQRSPRLRAPPPQLGGRSQIWRHCQRRRQRKRRGSRYDNNSQTDVAVTPRGAPAGITSRFQIKRLGGDTPVPAAWEPPAAP